jgi:mRNA interferase HigB
MMLRHQAALVLGKRTRVPSGVNLPPSEVIMSRHQHLPGYVAYYLISRYCCCMHVISRKTLRQFWAQHPDSESALTRWFKIMQRQDFTNLETVRATFPTADKVGDFIVFNIGGNKYRLITAIHFNRRKVYIRHVLTHPEYARGAWKT